MSRAGEGWDAVYGAPLDDVAVIEVPVDLAPLLADAHRRIRRRPAGIHRGDGVVRHPTGEAAGAAPSATDAEPPAEVVDALRAAERPIVLAGPGVVLEDCIDGLRALAAAASLGVLNTWGAKGVLHWESPHHLATAGLQAWDFERGGVADADLIVATGVDEREVRAPWRLAPVVEVPPARLGPAARLVTRPATEIAPPRLRTDLAAITQAGWAATAGPLPPTRVTRTYGEVLGDRGLVAADPGVAGYWVARTVPTTTPGGVLVTADPAGAGFAAAAVLVARLLAPDRPVLAVVDRIDERTARLLDVGAERGTVVPVEVWDGDGPPLGADEHQARLRSLVASGGAASVCTHSGQMGEMLEAAGPIVAWTT